MPWAPKMYTVRRTDPGVLISCVRHPVAFRNPWKFLPLAALPGCFKSNTSKSVEIDSRRHQYTLILHAVYRDFGRHRDRHRVPASFLRFVQRGICYVRHGPFIRRIDLGNVGNLRQRRLHTWIVDSRLIVIEHVRSNKVPDGLDRRVVSATGKARPSRPDSRSSGGDQHRRAAGTT